MKIEENLRTCSLYIVNIAKYFDEFRDWVIKRPNFYSKVNLVNARHQFDEIKIEELKYLETRSKTQDPLIPKM